MKSVLILRHAKSSWKHPELADHDRPLNKRGKRDAPRMGELLRSEHLIPEAIISSTATRARDTAEAVAKACGYKGEITLNRSLYAAGPEAYLKVLHGMSNAYIRVLVVGHNPGVQELAQMLTGETHLMSTCSLAHIKLHVDRWLDMDYETKGQLAGICRPRDLS
jgi:phosphohistidine phosphatase